MRKGIVWERVFHANVLQRKWTERYNKLDSS